MKKPSSEYMDCLTVAVRVRGPFFDLDSSGVVWHGRYFQYFELARCALLEFIGYSYDEMAASGVLWPVADSTVRYLRPLALNQDVLVSARLRQWEMRIVIDYRIVDASGTLYTRATTTQVPVDAETRELTFGSPEILVGSVRTRLRAIGSTEP
ncbi:MAG TPA: acyl-CoA thioesterase [Gammaproteobacteria bacterium]|nr:acyl-CoA thioesterase [Gammaproteobacteria bacterium]